MEEKFILFDDAREGGGQGRLYRRPVGEIVAWALEEVRPALEALRTATHGGRHVAGFIGYEAGQALDPALIADARVGEGPLLWFGLFEGYEAVASSSFGDPAGAFAGPVAPRTDQATYLAAAKVVREGLFA
ncbi:MAG: aminodeoxychorismate synthase, component I, partial [Sphingomicrobium sp.]